MRLLRRVEERVVGRERKVKMEGEEEEEEEDLGEEEEVKKVIKRLKDGKAMESGGVQGEAWRYGGTQLKRCGSYVIGFRKEEGSRRVGGRVRLSH